MCWGLGYLLKAKAVKVHGHQVLAILLSGFTLKVMASLMEYGWSVVVHLKKLLSGMLTVITPRFPLVPSWTWPAPVCGFSQMGTKAKISFQSFDHSTDTMLGVQNLTNSDTLVSSVSRFDHSSGRFFFIMQADANLVAYPMHHQISPQDAYWASKTAGSSFQQLSLDIVWATNLWAMVAYMSRYCGVPRLRNVKIKGFCGFNSYCSSLTGDAVWVFSWMILLPLLEHIIGICLSSLVFASMDPGSFLFTNTSATGLLQVFSSTMRNTYLGETHWKLH